MSSGSVLIIEDELDVAAYLGRIVSDNGWRVHIASGGDQGLELAHQEAPDVILLDLMMPGERGGLSTYTELCRDPSLQSIPVVFVTAFPEPDPGENDSFLGRQERRRPAAYLEKPVTPDALLAVLQEVTGSRDPTPSERS
jgi:CheY-like chemotaxis protein